MRRLVLVLAVTLTASVASFASPAAAATRTSVTATLAPTSILRGNTSYLSGSVFPKRPGKMVALQRYYGGAWHSAVAKPLTRRSTFKFRLRPTTSGTFTYRVKKVKDSGYRPSVSPKRVLRVVPATQALTALDPIEYGDGGASFDDDTTPTVNGVALSRSAEMQWDFCSRCGTDHVVYSLGGRWASLSTILGLRDDSPSGSTAKVEIFGDGRSLGTWSLAIGATQNVTLPVAGVQRLRLEGLALGPVNLVFGHPTLSSTAVAAVPAQPVTTFLDSFDPVESSSNDDAYAATRNDMQVPRLSGQYYGHGIEFQYDDWTCSSCVDIYVEYAISRAYGQLSFRMGLDDEYTAGSATVTITGDGAPLWSGTAYSGQAAPVTVNVAGVLRLRITVHSNTPDNSEPVVSLADVRLLS